MPIPAFNELGFLPAGVHDATIAEVQERFNSSNPMSRRAYLWRRLAAYLDQLREAGPISKVILDGSFVTAIENPGDVDLILVPKPGWTLPPRMTEELYDVISRQRVSATLEFDALYAETPQALEELLSFFQQVRGTDAYLKGLVRIEL